MAPIFITGGTGFIGQRLIKKLVLRGYDVTALIRKGSENKLPKGVRAIIADPLDAITFQQWIPKSAIFIQLLGVSHPSPKKKEFFQEIDLHSAKTSADAAAGAGVSHFIYLSVSMVESSLRQDYQQARRQGEAYLLTKGFPCTFIRPWTVVGPTRFWPVLLLPLYAVAKFHPAWQKKAEGMALVTVSQLMDTFFRAIESPPHRQRVFEIAHIKRGNLPAI